MRVVNKLTEGIKIQRGVHQECILLRPLMSNLHSQVIHNEAVGESTMGINRINKKIIFVAMRMAQCC